MILNRTPFKNLTKAEKARQKRLKRSLKPSTQNTLYFQNLFENGLLLIRKDEWSRTYRLGDVAYNSSNVDTKEEIIDIYTISK